MGVAAHITAASPGGPRYDPALTPQQRSSAKNGIWLCQICAKKIDNDLDRYPAGLLRTWKTAADAAAHSEVGRPRATGQRPGRGSIRAIKEKLRLRELLHQALLKPAEERRVRRAKHPYDKFQCHSVIVRDVEDKLYPEIDPTAPISGWHRLELFNFYHDGLEVVLGIVVVAQRADGRWCLMGERSHPPAGFSVRDAWQIGRIPYRNISVCDLDGDEYYREPHLYCAFVESGRPWADVRYAVVGRDEEYDWPLDSEKRLPLEGLKPNKALQPTSRARPRVNSKGTPRAARG